MSSDYSSQRAFTEIKHIETDSAKEVNRHLDSDWVVIGIQQRRERPDPNGFEDKTIYILGKKESED